MCKSPQKESHQTHRNINICAKFHIDLLFTCKFGCKFRQMHFNKVGLRLSLQPPFCSKNFHSVCCHPCLFNLCYAYFNKLRFRDYRRFAHAQGSNDKSSKARSSHPHKNILHISQRRNFASTRKMITCPYSTQHLSSLQNYTLAVQLSSK